jgi:sugar lactone lactonase YvrE
LRASVLAVLLGLLWASSAGAAGYPAVAGDVYSVAGQGTGGSGGPAVSASVIPGGLAFDSGGDLYLEETWSNRIEEIAATTHSQWGISMTAGRIYTVVGSSSGAWGNSGDGGSARSALLDDPEGITVDASGNLYIADTDSARIREVAASPHTQWGISMTAGNIYRIAGTTYGTFSGGGGPATAAVLA